MDVQKAIALVNRLEDTECLIIKKNDQIYQPYVWQFWSLCGEIILIIYTGEQSVDIANIGISDNFTRKHSYDASNLQ